MRHCGINSYDLRLALIEAIFKAKRLLRCARNDGYFISWTVLLVFLSFTQLFSQEYSFKNYTVAHGLGASSINHIFQDSKGYIWFATQGGGVSRFNGQDFKNFTKADGLINNDVTYLTEDQKGNIWIGTASGASYFNGNNFHNYTRQHRLTDGVVFSIFADTDNIVWFATQDHGIKIYNGSGFDSLTTTDGLPSNEIYAITKDNHGNFWFGLSYGIARYDGEKVNNYQDSSYIKDQAFFSAFSDNKGTVWFGSTGGTVIKIDGKGKIESIPLPALLENDFIGGIMQDKRNNMWFATDHGLLKYNGKNFKLFSEDEGLSVNIAQTVMCDYEGNIWCGTLGGGVNVLSSEAFIHYTEKDGLTSKNITCIFPVSNDSSYYIGTSNGLFVFTPNNEIPFKTVTDIRDLENSNIISISVDEQDLLWICTLEEVLVIEKTNGKFQLIKSYKDINGEPIISPTKIIHDKKGNCWIATYGSGLFCFSKTRLPDGQGEREASLKERSFNTKNGFPSDNLLTLYEDAQSKIWIGTQDAGIIKYDGKTFTPLLLKGAGGEAIWSITEDTQGNIQWSTNESGIFIQHGTETVNYTISNGLISNYYSALQWDSTSNSLWLGGEKGLERLQFHPNGQIAKIRHYSEQSGFKAVGINHNAIAIDNKGLILLGTADGLWQFNEPEKSSQTVPPKVHLSGIRIFYKEEDLAKYGHPDNDRNRIPQNLTLPYNKNHLTFDIQALTTQEVNYSFMLEGQDKTWSSPTKNNEITYSNISPGDEYTFKAKAVNSEGIESDEIISLSLVISPPWWATWWFRSIVALAVIGSLILFIKGRERILREQNIKLEATVQQRTAEIAQQKQVIENTLAEKEGLLSEKEVLLREIHHRVKNNLQTISSMLMLQGAGLKDTQAKKAIEESQSRVRSIALVHQKLYQTDGLEKVEMQAFIKDLVDQVKSFHRDESKEVVIDMNIQETHILIDKAIPLGLMLNELITNSFKYAFNSVKQGNIKIAVNHLPADKADSMIIQLIYWDNGTGLDAALIENATTLGLRLIKLLSQQIGATMEYSRNDGSEFVFRFKLNI